MAMTPNPTGLYIKEITLPSGNTYEIVDEGARELIGGLSGYTDFLGVLQTTGNNVEEGSTCAAIILSGGTTATAIKGSIVIKPMGTGNPSQEYIYDGTQWQMFGDISADNLGELATANTAVVYYTPNVASTGTITVNGQYTLATELVTATVTAPLTTTSALNNEVSTAGIIAYSPQGTVDIDVYNTITASVISDIGSTTLINDIVAVTYDSSITSSVWTEGVPEKLSTAKVINNNLILNWFQLSSTTASSTPMVQSITAATVKTGTLSGTPIYFLPVTIDIPTGISTSTANITSTGIGIVEIVPSTTAALPVTVIS